MAGQTITDTSIQQASYGLDDGICVAISGGKLGFFGTAPTSKATLTNAAAVTAGSTTTVCNTGLAELVTELVAKGIIAAS
jgi:uncharacterized 2Fe-2S/4Fe-4S cluster protein (DUF4445 family)